MHFAGCYWHRNKSHEENLPLSTLSIKFRNEKITRQKVFTEYSGIPNNHAVFFSSGNMCIRSINKCEKIGTKIGNVRRSFLYWSLIYGLYCR